MSESNKQVEKEAVTSASPGPTKQKKQSFFQSNRFKRGAPAILMSVLFVAFVVVLNVLVTMFADRYPSINIDLSANKLNSLSEESIEVAKKIENPTEIIIIGEEEKIRQDKLSSTYKLSQVANLSDRMSEINRNISVSFIDPDKNPAFINRYPDDNLIPGTVLVKTETRYKVLSMPDLFGTKTNQQTQQPEYFSKVDGALANALDFVNLTDVPLISIASGHQEMLTPEYRSTLDAILKERGYEVKEFALLTEAVPEGTDVIILPTPTTDFTKEEIQKFRDFLSDEVQEARTILLTADPEQGALPVLSEYLEEWGVKVEDGVVVETDPDQTVLNSPLYVLANSAGKILEENEYSFILSLKTSPLSILFEYNDDVSVEPLLVSSDKAGVLTEGNTNLDALPTSEQTLATYSYKFANINGVDMNKNVIVFGSTYAFLSDILGNSTFGNKSYVTDLLDTVTGMQASTVYIPDTQTNQMDVTASAQTLTNILLITFTIALPILILTAGLLIFLRRRHL